MAGGGGKGVAAVVVVVVVDVPVCAVGELGSLAGGALARAKVSLGRQNAVL